jgi:CubicO group peptidase (beta-lactamase class C family)
MDRLAGFEAYVEQTLEEWNVPGAAVCVMADGEVLLSRGFRWRDWGSRAPFTEDTLFPIASNTKLFTAIAAGLLVEEGKLAWDRPIREFVPSIQFNTEALNAQVTLRDMLAHRTGIHRHDSVWNKAGLSSREIFERLRHLRPVEPLRQSFIYNNLMYAGVGYVIELLSGQPWRDFVRDRLLTPLGMGGTVFSIDEMRAADDFAVPYTEQRDSDELVRVPQVEQLHGAAPAGGMVSNLHDMTSWLRLLMNEGRVGEQQLVPASVLRETLAPAVAFPNALAELRGWRELLNATYGMGRNSGVYRGHLITYHGGTLDGVHSQVMLLPHERIGVISFVLGDHAATLRDTLAYNAIERLLGLEPTPWNERYRPLLRTLKSSMTQARSRAGGEQIANTRPSHARAEYAGDFEHPAYGRVRVREADGALRLSFKGFELPLQHFHYDRFDTPDDEFHGKWSVNFTTDPLGDIASLRMSLDEAEAEFTRSLPLPTPAELERLVGAYRTVSGLDWRVALKDGKLYLCFPGSPDLELAPYKPLRFRIPQFPDRLYTFREEAGAITRLDITWPQGVYLLTRVTDAA